MTLTKDRGLVLKYVETYFLSLHKIRSSYVEHTGQKVLADINIGKSRNSLIKQLNLKRQIRR